MQLFYLISHIIDSTLTPDKIFLQEKEAIKWGRRYATQNPECTVHLYRQDITRQGTLVFVKELHPFMTSEQALELARKFNLEDEVQHALDKGATPYEACKEYDLF